MSLHDSHKDQHGLPIPCLHIDDHPNETPTQNYGYKKMDEMCMALGARRMIEAQAEPAYHHLGVCRMSQEPRNGVVDPWGRAHEVPNLFVSDGSAFPSSGAANPTLTVVALAIRQAERIAAMMSAGELKALALPGVDEFDAGALEVACVAGGEAGAVQVSDGGDHAECAGRGIVVGENGKTHAGLDDL